jgi:DNA helicase-2/ATP-dependent DNA helicase PcrA
LNPNQIKAVRHSDKPALTLSVAGCGKTQTLTSRLAYLIKVKNVDPSSILLLTFTNRAAKEMKERAHRLFPEMKNEINKIVSGTYHSVCLGILREHGDTREVWSSGKSKEITIKTILRSLGIDKHYEPENILSLISHYKNNLMGLEDVPMKKSSDKEFCNIFQKYEEHMKKSSLMDFDNMLFDTYKLFMTKPEILKKIQNRFKYIMIDEGQDNNHSQFELAKMIALPENNIFLVADDDQTIFSFNGAKSENVLNFDKIYPDAEIIYLDTNYRSVDTILGLANTVISKNTNRREKVSQSVTPSDIYPRFISPLSVEEEASQIVREIKQAVENGHNYSEFAILHRTSSNARAIFEELILEEVPFLNYGSEEVFYENSVVKPLISYLRLTIEPKNMKAVADVLPTLYLGKDKLKYIETQQSKKSIDRPIEHLLTSEIKPFQRSKVSDRLRLINRIGNMKPIIAIRTLREDYEHFLIGDDSQITTTLFKEVIKETISELESSSKKYNTIHEFIEYIDKIIKNTRIQKEIQKKGSTTDTVKLMTIHKSKGMEYDHVFGISLNDGILPHKSALEECTDIITSSENYSGVEEELRLLYVLITRAKTFLTLSIPKTLRGVAARPSRFLSEFVSDEDDDHYENEEDEFDFDEEHSNVFS